MVGFAISFIMISLPAFSTAKPIVAVCHPLRCYCLLFSSAPRSAKPTTALSCPLRCMRRSVSVCFRAAKPISEPSRLLRCINLSVSTCSYAAAPISTSPCPLRCSYAGPIVSASVRFCPSLFCEAHSSPLLTASIAGQRRKVRFQ